MFKRVISYPGFWKSAIYLSVVYGLVLLLIQWMMSGFSRDFMVEAFGSGRAWVFFVAGAVAGISSTYAKFWKHLKEQDHNNK